MAAGFASTSLMRAAEVVAVAEVVRPNSFLNCRAITRLFPLLIGYGGGGGGFSGGGGYNAGE